MLLGVSHLLVDCIHLGLCLFGNGLLPNASCISNFILLNLSRFRDQVFLDLHCEKVLVETAVLHCRQLHSRLRAVSLDGCRQGRHNAYGSLLEHPNRL